MEEFDITKPIYIMGKSEALTLDRLQAVAQALASDDILKEQQQKRAHVESRTVISITSIFRRATGQHPRGRRCLSWRVLCQR